MISASTSGLSSGRLADYAGNRSGCQVASAQSEVSSLETVVNDGLLEIRRGPTAETCLIQLSGELDLATAGSLERELRHVETLNPKTIVLDLQGLEFIDSTGIALLVEARHRAEANGHALGLTRAAGPVQRVLELSGLNRVLASFDDTGSSP